MSETVKEGLSIMSLSGGGAIETCISHRYTGSMILGCAVIKLA